MQQIANVDLNYMHCKQCIRYKFGQIIATSVEVTPNGGFVRQSPQNALNSGLGIIVICPHKL